MGLDEGLVVFSGNNGVHVWYPLMDEVARHAFAYEGLRDKVLADLADKKGRIDNVAMDAALDREHTNWPLTNEQTAAAVLFDENPSKPWKEIRCPFSMNTKSKTPSFPIGHSGANRQPFPFEDDVADRAGDLLADWAPPSSSWLKKPGSDTPTAVPMAVASVQVPMSPILINPPSPTSDQLFLRMATLKPLRAKNRYGDRCSVPLSAIHQPGFLSRYSLIIPSITGRGDIPSKASEQAAFSKYWHMRYYGLLDLDTQFKEYTDNGVPIPIFPDRPDLVTDSSHRAKLFFVDRMVRERRTFGEMANLCPLFKPLLQLAIEIARALPPASGFVYYSGGAGFRVLLFTQAA
jgi:hypothetical protein